MRTKKRRKSERRHGKQTAFRGKKARTRGSGNQGGKGMAGTGKRGDQKKTLVIKLTGGNNYFKKDKALRKPVVVKLQAVNLSDIQQQIDNDVAAGKAKPVSGFYEIKLVGYKILSDGEILSKVKIFASAASASAIEKVKEAGGEIILSNVSQDDSDEDSQEESEDSDQDSQN